MGFSFSFLLKYSIVPLPLLQQKATQNCRYPRDKTPLTHVQG